MKESKQNESEKQEQIDENVDAEEYQHVKEPKNSDKTTLDNATEEQSKQIKHQEDEEPKDEADGDNADELMADEEVPAAQEQDDTELEQLSSEKTDQKSDKPSKTEQAKERVEEPQQMEIEGEVVATMTVPRSTETTAHSK